VLALRAATTPGHPPRADVPELVVGDERVLAAALTALAERHGARVVRVDSGGALIGALLERGLLCQVSLLGHPVLAGRGNGCGTAAGPRRGRSS